MKSFVLEPKAIFRKQAFFNSLCVLLIAALILLLSTNSFAQTNEYEYQVPKKLNDEWEVSSLRDEGIDEDAIEEISRIIRDTNSYENVLSMLIIKNGKLVHEEYSPYCQRNTLHWMASITKTITSTLIGIAIDKGFIESADAKLYELLPQFAEKYLLHPMGIYAYQWNKDPMGYPCTGGTDGGLGLRTRDIAKFGWLFLKDGKWKGKQIISEKWVKGAPTTHMTTKGRGRSYAFNWMTGSRTINGKRFDYIASFGYGGQNLYIVPEYDLIIVFKCELSGADSGVNRLVKKTFEAIIPK